MHNNINFNIETLIEEYTPYVFKVIDNAVGTNLSFEDKEEVISDTFYLLWKNQDKIETNLKAYLAKIAKNCAFYKMRKNNITLELNEELAPSITNSLDETLDIIEKLNLLNSEEKLIFNLYYLKGYKIKDISKIIKKSTSNIKVKLYRIRKKLKEGLR